MADVLLSADHGAVRILTLHRPEKKNAFDVELADALWTALDAASADDSVRCVIVTAMGDTFTAGADVSLFLEAANPQSKVDISRVARLHEPLRACTKPVIAAVQGPAIGMGVTILPHFDLVYASERATFLVPFVRLGLVVEYGGSFTLQRLIGHQRAREMLLRARPLDATTAERWGLVTRVFREGTLLDDVLAIALDVASHPPGASAECRRLMEQGMVGTLDDAIEEENRALALRYGSPENVDAVMAFLQRKKKS